MVRAKLRAGAIHLHAWVYKIETGEVYAYDAVQAEFVRLEDQFPAALDCAHADVAAAQQEAIYATLS